MNVNANEKLCIEAAEIARAEVLAAARKGSLTIDRLIAGIVAALDAHETKVFYDKDRGKCVMSPDLIAWNARLKAIDQGISILGLQAPTRQEVSGNIDFDYSLTQEVQEIFDKIYDKTGSARKLLPPVRRGKNARGKK